MSRAFTKPSLRQSGLSLIELMVGLAIGLITTLIITQVMVAYEGQKRGTSGSAEAQTSGSIALYMIQRSTQMAGYGLPLYSSNSPLNCSNSNDTFDHDGDGGETTPTPEIGIPPVAIVDGGNAPGVSDTITTRFGTQQMGGLTMEIVDVTNAPVLGVVNNLGCQAGDVAIVINGSTCGMSTVASLTGTQSITLNASAGVVNGARIACLGGWQDTIYRVNNGSLEENGAAIMANIVNMQAQYGISDTASSNVISQWVDAVDASAAGGDNWAAPSVANRNRIKAIRIAIVARNSVLEREAVANVPCQTGQCIWIGNDQAAAGTNASIDLTNDADWQNYRYRLFETVVPIRNVIWSFRSL